MFFFCVSDFHQFFFMKFLRKFGKFFVGSEYHKNLVSRMWFSCPVSSHLSYNTKKQNRFQRHLPAKTEVPATKTKIPPKTTSKKKTNAGYPRIRRIPRESSRDPARYRHRNRQKTAEESSSDRPRNPPKNSPKSQDSTRVRPESGHRISKDQHAESRPDTRIPVGLYRHG